jgi:16S rRNA (cytosine1402-N4)-methyltransferase
MLREVLAWLAIRPDGVYVDMTTGLGGHTREIARRLTTGWVLANDRDAASLELARRNTSEEAERIRFHRGDFSGLREALREQGVEQADGVLADLGVSRYQLTSPERGFSILSDGPLDMRMDQSQEVTAADLINHGAEKQLADWIFQYGEERRARKLARAIVRARPIRSTAHLADVLEKAVPRTGPLHPATRVFMALRIVVNQELEQLGELLQSAPEATKPGGRIVIISFHSLEDRMVKERFRNLARAGQAVLLTRKPQRPDEDEVRNNPSARSARLRAIEVRGSAQAAA